MGFGGLKLQPLRYLEEVDSDGQITIRLRIDLNATYTERFEGVLWEQTSDDNDGYFDLVRHGISEPALRVRFGRCYWQRWRTDAHI